MTVLFRAISEDIAGPKWAAQFASYWPSYAAWWAREGLSGRPTYHECRQAIKKHMPEISGLYEDLCELVGGGDKEARFLSFYCPPRYLAGCSQAIWPGDEPLLVRNYDYDKDAFDAVILKTKWNGRGVIGTTDGLFGLVDGMNDAGLSASLTFGGRREVGTGFGVPLILRYILQTCTTTEEAGKVLRRVPSHMSYNVTVLDAKRHFLTAYLTPDRPTVLTHAAVATNHQERVEWASHAKFTATVERERYLLQRLTLHPETQEKFIGAFLRPPLYSTAFSSGFGTLYTAAYRPKDGVLDVHWPDRKWTKGFDNFSEDSVRVVFPGQIHQVAR
ncbi:Predicted choloylglycine hydrolase [Cognatiyoonia koreensis]|uniref:Predicted choloylglycine hydrolase n=1 Tax=Cognatiyoonia koreensis TaxID=364200 RepID=A0A1I0PWA3_9RHOB|nr:C45 family peptidase [Cognatiyoonia koreensis]SEW18803.1 Predicted choloylglycine hydrolase [Cognatiyoonia koreensis]